MNKLFVIFIILLLGCAPAPVSPSSKPDASVMLQDALRWSEFDLNALDLAKTTKRPVLVYFHLDSCNVCIHADKTTFSNRDVVRLINKEFVPTKIEVDKNDGGLDILIALTGLARVPSVAFLTSNGVKIDHAVGYVSPSNMLKLLERAQMRALRAKHTTESIHESISGLIVAPPIADGTATDLADKDSH